MAEVSAADIARIVNSLKTKMLADLDAMLVKNVKVAEATMPGLSTEIIVAAAVKCMAVAHNRLAEIVNVPFSPKEDQVTIAALVMARYITRPAIQMKFSVVDAWNTAATDVERLKAPKQ